MCLVLSFMPGLDRVDVLKVIVQRARLGRHKGITLFGDLQQPEPLLLDLVYRNQAQFVSIKQIISYISRGYYQQ